MAKKKVVKKAVKAPQQRAVRHEIVVRVAPQDVPTVEDLSVPIKDGKELTIPKTWMSEKQIMRMVQATPPQHRYKRPGKGGGTFEYVTGSYVTRVLNFVFGWNWDFEVVQQGKEDGVVWVLGKLTVHGEKQGQTITKTQYGRAEVKMKRDGKGMLDFGNDLKAAATDSLKKCASMLGVASDIYGKSEYKEEAGRDAREMQPAQLPAPAADGPVEEIYCHGVGKGGCPQGSELSQSERDYSVNMYGRPLCRGCQKLAGPIKKK